MNQSEFEANTCSPWWKNVARNFLANNMLYMGLGTSCQHCTNPSPKKLFCIIRSESYIEASKSLFMFGCENFSVYVHITVIAALTKICCLFALSFPLSSSSISHLPPYFFCCMISVILLGLFVLNLWWWCIWWVIASQVGYICFRLSLFTSTLDTDFLLLVLTIMFGVLWARFVEKVEVIHRGE